MDAGRIVVVDDEVGIGMLCQRLLAREGHTVEVFSEPRAAVNWLAEHQTDLLIVDIRMPEVDGFEVVAHTQRLQPNAAILIMTGYGTVQTAIRALHQGVDGLILKPFEHGASLLDAVGQAMDNNRKKKDAARVQAIRELFAVNEKLFSETDLRRLPELIVEAMRENLHCTASGLFECDESDSAPRPIGWSGPKAEFLAAALWRASRRPTPHGDEPTAGATPAAIAAPATSTIVLEGTVVALTAAARPGAELIFCVLRPLEMSPFSELELELLQLLSRQATVALENARLYAEQWENLERVRRSQKALVQAEKMATAGRLSASIAHEVNNPLQAMQNCLHLAGRADLPPEKRQEYFDLAKSELERLRVTVRRMLDFSRPGSGAHQTQDVGQIVRYVVSLMAKQLAEARVEVRLDLPEVFPPMRLDGSQIQQVFINLVLNAADAMPAGGQILISGRVLEGGIELTLADTGPGIPPERQGSIFEPFYSTREGGTGLGLTVSYNIISAHGGTLELVSGAGPGACFRVFLPAGGAT